MSILDAPCALMKTKTISVVCFLTGIAPIVGVFNQVRHALTAVPGVSITREWANKDVTLEEFGFHITTSAGQPLHLIFPESDPLRNLSGQQLTTALTTRIQQEIPSTKPEQ